MPEGLPEWWSGGVRFTCIGCGRCCRGEPGAVFFTPEVEDRLLEAMEVDGRKLEKREFRRRCVTLKWGQPSFVERPNGDCVFYDAEKARCKIYPLRPAQCSLFPFWLSVMDSKTDWDREALRCPGMNDGRLYSAEEICALLARDPFELDS
jgi:Fe-S-cluster containining protein